MNNSQSTGRVAVITGASSGIGAATARALASEGYKVALLARRLDRLAAALKTYKEQHDYLMSTGTCAGGTFDSDANLGFLADLEREAIINAIPRDTDGIAKSTKAGQGKSATTSAEDCGTMYGAKHYLCYSNGTKFALIASVDDADAIPNDAAGVYLAEGDRE